MTNGITIANSMTAVCIDMALVPFLGTSSRMPPGSELIWIKPSRQNRNPSDRKIGINAANVRRQWPRNSPSVGFPTAHTEPRLIEINVQQHASFQGESGKRAAQKPEEFPMTLPHMLKRIRLQLAR